MPIFYFLKSVVFWFVQKPSLDCTLTKSVYKNYILSKSVKNHKRAIKNEIKVMNVKQIWIKKFSMYNLIKDLLKLINVIKKVYEKPADLKNTCKGAQ